MQVFQANEASKEKVVRRHKGGNGEEIEVEETKNGDLVQVRLLHHIVLSMESN